MFVRFVCKDLYLLSVLFSTYDVFYTQSIPKCWFGAVKKFGTVFGVCNQFIWMTSTIVVNVSYNRKYDKN